MKLFDRMYMGEIDGQVQWAGIYAIDWDSWTRWCEYGPCPLAGTGAGLTPGEDLRVSRWWKSGEPSLPLGFGVEARRDGGTAPPARSWWRRVFRRAA